jgi:quercetin dioxygenase-like cupin family protein
MKPTSITPLLELLILATFSFQACVPKLTETIFPKGEKITHANFHGAAWLQPLVASDSLNPIAVGNVTFAPGARTKWHSHPGGQILLATGGIGYYQEQGKPGKILRKGDVVKCPPTIVHWHGASRDTEFIQLAITSSEKGGAVWLQPVTEEEYNSIK